MAPIKNILHKPVEIVQSVLNKKKPHIDDVPTGVMKPEFAEVLKPGIIEDKPGIIDSIRRPIQALFNGPAEIASDFLHRPHEGAIHFPSEHQNHLYPNLNSYYGKLPYGYRNPYSAYYNNPYYVYPQTIGFPSVYYRDLETPDPKLNTYETHLVR